MTSASNNGNGRSERTQDAAFGSSSRWTLQTLFPPPSEGHNEVGASQRPSSSHSALRCNKTAVMSPRPSPSSFSSRSLALFHHGSRLCRLRTRNLPHASYTSNQWSKSSKLSRCAACVHGHSSDTPATQQPDSGRYNDADSAEFSHDALNNPFAPGAFRWVAKWVYASGVRSGQACVLKWFKTGAVFEEDYFDLDIKAANRALEIVSRFNESDIINKIVKINVPSVCVFEDKGSQDGQKALIEPFIQNYQKFNSNTGWKDDWGAWAQVMQALSRRCKPKTNQGTYLRSDWADRIPLLDFSYHVSGGSNVLCDLQGGIYQHEVVLFDPVILSRTGEYGVTDLGPNCISSFFYYHGCNQYCRPSWTKPSKPLPHFNRFQGTTMRRHTVPTAFSRPSDTRAYTNR